MADQTPLWEDASPGRESRVLHDDLSEDHLRRHGYAVVPGLADDDLESFASDCDALGLNPSAPFHAGLPGRDESQKRAVHELVVRHLRPLVDRHFLGHRPLIGSLAVKRSHPESGMRVHQDWTVVDERHWRSVNLWCPMVDVDGANGALHLLAGSHALTPLRGSDIPHSCRAIADLPLQAFERIDLRAGQAIVYFHNTVHRSTPNRSGRTRVAAMLGLVPQGALPVHFRARSAGEVDVYLADTEFYLTYRFEGSDPPAGAERVGSMPWDGTAVGHRDLVRSARLPA